MADEPTGFVDPSSLLPHTAGSRNRYRDIKYSTDPTKKACRDCDGHGKLARLTDKVGWPDSYGDAMPPLESTSFTREVCPTCTGSGYVPYTPEEQAARDARAAATGVVLTEADEAAARREDDRRVRTQQTLEPPQPPDPTPLEQPQQPPEAGQNPPILPQPVR